MADAGGRAAAQTAVPPRTVHTAGGAGYVVFGTVGQDFQFFTQVHGIFLLKKGIKNTARRIGLSCKPCRGQHFFCERDSKVPIIGCGNCYNNLVSGKSPLGFGLHHFAGNVQVIEIFALDDQFLVGRVEGVQHHRVAALDVLL